MRLAMETLLVKYGLPGIPSSLTIYIALIFLWQAEKTPINPSSPSVITALALITVLIGYLCFQTWMLLFELPWTSYKSKGRRALTKIKEEYSGEELSNDELYAIWENVLYRMGDTEKNIFEKDKGMWRFYHQNNSFFLGYMVSAVISSLLIWFSAGRDLMRWWLVVIPTIQIFLASLAYIKARQTLNLIELLEASLVDFWASDFRRAIKKVLNSRKYATISSAKRKNKVVE